MRAADFWLISKAWEQLWASVCWYLARQTSINLDGAATASGRAWKHPLGFNGEYFLSTSVTHSSAPSPLHFPHRSATENMVITAKIGATFPAAGHTWQEEKKKKKS